MVEGRTQTNIELTDEERMALKVASGDPYSHGALVDGVRAMLTRWEETEAIKAQRDAAIAALHSITQVTVCDVLGAPFERCQTLAWDGLRAAAPTAAEEETDE